MTNKKAAELHAKTLYAEEGGHLIEEKSAAGAIGLNPLAIEDELRDGALASVGDDFGGGSRVGIDIDLAVGDGVGCEESLGLAAIATPWGGVDEQFHASILRRGRRMTGMCVIAWQKDASIGV
jgi:hypothetical protein